MIREFESCHFYGVHGIMMEKALGQLEDRDKFTIKKGRKGTGYVKRSIEKAPII